MNSIWLYIFSFVQLGLGSGGNQNLSFDFFFSNFVYCGGMDEVVLNLFQMYYSVDEFVNVLMFWRILVFIWRQVFVNMEWENVRKNL